MKLKSIGIYVYNKIAALVKAANEYGSIVCFVIAYIELIREKWIYCFAFLGFAILFAIWDSSKKPQIKLKYWAKMRMKCLALAQENVGNGLLSADQQPGTFVIKTAHNYFNYMLSGKIPLTEEQERLLK